MKQDNSIMVLGDVHREFGALNTLVNKKRPEIILQCGDFGFWPNITRHDERGDVIVPKKPVMNDAKLYWADGNHEDHRSLRSLSTNEIWPNVYYMKRGSTMTLPDGRTVLFVGGARSIDKAMRTMGFDWFPEEEISEMDLALLPDTKVDIVISHTCPREFAVMGNDMRADDSSRMVLSYVLARYQPSLWYFGHFHYYRTGVTRGCRWVGLSMTGCTGWWEWLR
jgi:Icc-related predicted phosphoesterase